MFSASWACGFSVWVWVCERGYGWVRVWRLTGVCVVKGLIYKAGLPIIALAIHAAGFDSTVSD